MLEWIGLSFCKFNTGCDYSSLQGFSQPHDLAVDPTSGATYVGEIGPNRIWKFVSITGMYEQKRIII